MVATSTRRSKRRGTTKLVEDLSPISPVIDRAADDRCDDDIGYLTPEGKTLKAQELAAEPIAEPIAEPVAEPVAVDEPEHAEESSEAPVPEPEHADESSEAPEPIETPKQQKEVVLQLNMLLARRLQKYLALTARISTVPQAEKTFAIDLVAAIDSYFDRIVELESN